MHRSKVIFAAATLCAVIALRSPNRATAQCGLAMTLPNPTPTVAGLFGVACALSGDRVVVGASGNNNGAAYVINAVSGALLMTLSNPEPDFDYDRFGSSVAISGNRVVVGAPYDDVGIMHDIGTAYVFDATSGALISTLISPAPAMFDSFGLSVAISGDVVLVGGYDQATSLAGAGRVDEFNAATGALILTINNPAPAGNDAFGTSLATSGDKAVVGALLDDAWDIDAGTAYVFNVTTGELITTLSNPAPGAGDLFGASVAISGEVAVVGANGDDTLVSNGGTAYVFNAMSGALIATLNNPAPVADGNFGISVAISGNVAVVGATQTISSPNVAGAAYAFDATSGALLATLENPKPAIGYYFGRSVAVSGGTVVVGDYEDDTAADYSGSAYIYACVLATPTPAPTPTPIVDPGPARGDFDDSGCTDIKDFLFLLDYWQMISPIGPPAIDINDFLALVDNWQLGPTCP